MTSAALCAQSKAVDVANLTFEVVSIKPNKSEAGGTRWGRHPGGGWFMVNMATAFLITSAYPTKVDDLVGAPAWVMSDRFDIDTRATFVPTPDQERTMLRALLADRFQFAGHYETQERPIYHLVVARADGRLGPQLQRIDIDCAPYKPRPRTPGEPAPPVSEAPVCGFRMSGGSATLSIVSGGRNMKSLADTLSKSAGRPIVDKTGLAGYYAYTLKFDGATADGLSVFTALQEQLGLKLEPARAPLDVVVIDRIERPSEN